MARRITITLINVQSDNSINVESIENIDGVDHQQPWLSR